jgi:hypothetical protein
VSKAPAGTDENALLRRIAELEEELARYRSWRPPGDFYSPIPDLSDMEARADVIFDGTLRELPGIESRVPEQVALAEVFRSYYADQPWTPEGGQPDRRYRFENDQFSYSDALFLHFMMRHVKPHRIVEVGSGHSSAAMLDTSELFLDDAVEFTFIDPYPERLMSVLRPTDHERIRILEVPVQDVPLEEFDQLEANDILFIDSTHVSKTGSDVNWIYFEVLPRLANGVYVHVHDIHFPFEYPREWVMEGRAWNEAYLLRAFLQFNSTFEIVVMNTALERFQQAWFHEHMPLCLKNPGGSLWLRRKT